MGIPFAWVILGFQVPERCLESEDEFVKLVQGLGNAQLRAPRQENLGHIEYDASVGASGPWKP